MGVAQNTRILFRNKFLSIKKGSGGKNERNCHSYHVYWVNKRIFIILSELAFVKYLIFTIGSRPNFPTFSAMYSNEILIEALRLIFNSKKIEQIKQNLVY